MLKFFTWDFSHLNLPLFFLCKRSLLEKRVLLRLTLVVILKELDQQTNHTSDAPAEGEMKNRGSELGSFIVEFTPRESSAKLQAKVQRFLSSFYYFPF